MTVAISLLTLGQLPPLTCWETRSPLTVSLDQGTADIDPEPLIPSSQLDLQRDDHSAVLRIRGHGNMLEAIHTTTFCMHVHIQYICIYF